MRLSNDGVTWSDWIEPEAARGWALTEGEGKRIVMLELRDRAGNQTLAAEDEIQLDYVHASGPGGQNVNKTATAAQLRFDVVNSPSLPDDVRQRLIQLAGRRVTREGVLVIDARRYRSQERNRKDAIDRLKDLIRVAAKERPFFLAWRPQAYPYEIGFVWVTNDPQPVNQLTNGMVGFSFDCEGII